MRLWGPVLVLLGAYDINSSFNYLHHRAAHSFANKEPRFVKKEMDDFQLHDTFDSEEPNEKPSKIYSFAKQERFCEQIKFPQIGPGYYEELKIPKKPVLVLPKLKVCSYPKYNTPAPGIYPTEGVLL